MHIKYIVRLSAEERQYLFKLINDGKSGKEKLNRARILLKADVGIEGEGWDDTEIAEALYVALRTVERTRKALVEEGFEAAINRKLPSVQKKRIIEGDEEAHLIALACSEPPDGYCKWTLRLLANHMVELKYVETVSHETVRKTLKKNEIKPWQKKEWCIPPKSNAAFACQMEEVLDIYKTPYDPNRPVVCLDESSKQLVEEVRPPLPAAPGVVQKYDTEYERNGTANIFIAFEPLDGFRITKVTEQRTKIDWAKFVQGLVDNERYKNTDKIVLVMDNLNTHNKSSLYEAFEPKEAKRIADKLEIHYTPKHGSWLNMAEIELSHLSRQCLDRRIAEREILSHEIGAWTEIRNNKKSGTNWQFTTADARIKLRSLYPTIID